MASVNVLLFDIDGTLCEYRRTAENLLPLAFARVGVEPFFDAQTYYNRYEEFTGDGTDVHSFRERCFAALAEERGKDPEVGRAVARAYAEERDPTDVVTHPGAERVLSHLHEEYRMGVVTNGGPKVQKIKLSAAGFSEYFETMVYGGYDTAAKPAPEPFERALAELDVLPSNALHVGDSLHHDIAGAKAAGLQAAWVASKDDDQTGFDPQPDFVLESLESLCQQPWKE